jgi:preprotein translocase subunit SecG
MTLLIGFLSFFLVLNCIFLVFLVLLQLPKKEAGAGVAFGGGATDALFGAGTGNMLTKITKWSAAIFFLLCLLLAVISGHQARQTGARSLQEELTNKPKPANTSGTGLLQTPTTTPAPTTSGKIAAPAPEATPEKPVPSAAPGANPPPTATPKK